MRNSDRAWLALAAGVAAYDLAANDDEQLTDAARRYFKSKPLPTAAMILMTGLHLIGGIPRWCDPFALLFGANRRLRRQRLWSPYAAAKRAPVGTSESCPEALAA